MSTYESVGDPHPSAGQASGSANAERVLAEFDTLRKELLGLLGRGEYFGHELGTISDQLTPFFRNARGAVDLTRLNLTIVGGEGHGKSTLINSIIGHEVTPSERKHPGTVAPTYAESGGSLTPSFSVTVRSDKGELVEQPCRDLSEFREYILQHKNFNPNNTKGVVCGTVRINNAVLNRGLRIVDMPGLQAANPLVNEQARRFIREQTHALVVVCRERMGFGTVRSIIEDLGVDVNRIHAVVINCSELDFRVRDGSGVALPDGELRVELRSIREEAAEVLEVHVDKIFTVHLPTLESVRVFYKDPLVSIPAHSEEVERFMNHLWSFIRRNGVADVIAHASQEATAALLPLAKRFELSQRVVDALLNGDTEEQTRVKAQFDLAREHARKLWGQVGREAIAKGIAQTTWSSGPPPEVVAASGDAAANRVAADQWPPLKKAVTAAREPIVAAIDHVLIQVEATPGKISETQAAAWRKTVELARLSAYEGLEKAQKDLQSLIKKYYIEHANAALRIIYQEVAILSSLVEGGLVIEDDDIERVALGGTDPSVLEKVAKWGLAGAIGTIAATVAGGGGALHLLVGVVGLTAGGAFAVGGALGAAAAYGLWSLFRDELRSSLTKGLAEFRESTLASLDVSDGGPVRAAWSQSVAAISRAVGAYLEGQFEQILEMLATPSGTGKLALERKRDALAAAMNGIADIRHEVVRVTKRAEGLP